MSEKEYKIKYENLFKKNTILLNQQQIDAEHIRALQKQNGELTDKVRELEAQIEKMINEIDKTMVLSNMCECEICDIQDIFRKNGFKWNEEKWEIKEK